MIYTHRMGRKPLGKKRLNISLPPNMVTELTEAAAEQGRDRSDLIAQIVREYLHRRRVQRKPKGNLPGQAP